MPMREVLDANGTTWTVCDCRPNAQSGTTAADRLLAPMPRFSPGREGGWLSFVSTDERRRLSPIPDGWEQTSDRELRSYLEQADRVRKTI